MDILLNKLKINSNYHLEASYIEDKGSGSINNKNREFVSRIPDDILDKFRAFEHDLRKVLDDYSSHEFTITGVEVKRKDGNDEGIVIYADKHLPENIFWEIKSPVIVLCDYSLKKAIQTKVEELVYAFDDFLNTYIDDRQFKLFEPTQNFEVITKNKELLFEEA